MVVLLLRHLLHLLLPLLPLLLLLPGCQPLLVLHEVLHPEVVVHDPLVILAHGEVVGSIDNVLVILAVAVRFEAVLESGDLVLSLGVPGQDGLAGGVVQ